MRGLSTFGAMGFLLNFIMLLPLVVRGFLELLREPASFWQRGLLCRCGVLSRGRGGILSSCVRDPLQFCRGDSSVMVARASLVLRHGAPLKLWREISSSLNCSRELGVLLELHCRTGGSSGVAVGPPLELCWADPSSSDVWVATTSCGMDSL